MHGKQPYHLRKRDFGKLQAINDLDFTLLIPCSVTPWSIGEGQNLQQSVEELQTLIEKLGAKKSGLFVVECDSFHSSNGRY